MKPQRNTALDKRAASLKLNPRPRQTSGYMTDFFITPRLTVAEQYDSERMAHLEKLARRYKMNS
jgi:hypothetical protein